MTYQEFATLLGTICKPGTTDPLPLAYYEFEREDPATLPFLVFYYPYRNDVMADNINYQPIEHTVLELYTEEIDLPQEQAVEAVLAGAEIAYSKNRNYIDSEMMWQIVYEFDLVITEDISNA